MPLKYFRHADRIRGLGDLGEAVALELHLGERGDQPPPRVLFDHQVAHVDLADLILHEPERGIEAAVEQVRLVRVPAHADAGWLPP